MIPFNRPYLTGNELSYIEEAYKLGQLSGDGYFTDKCSRWIENSTGTAAAFLTHSCTAALEMTAILADIQLGDEIIMPSYTFVSTANAFVLRGGVPVFVDIREDTLNIDETKIRDAITSRTKAIAVVHYAGNPCEMDVIENIAREYKLILIEDAAQAFMSLYKGRPLGSIGDFGCFSFHESKNIHSGEGGALLVNNPKYVERATEIRDKGTNRAKYFKGEVDKYSWVDIGSSYLPGEIVAAFLWAQLQMAREITTNRSLIWSKYHKILEVYQNNGMIRRPITNQEYLHNSHLYFLILNSPEEADSFIRTMNNRGVNCLFHYVPLHSSIKGKTSSRVSGSMDNTLRISQSIVRMPLWIGVDVEKVCSESNLRAALAKQFN